MNFECMNKDEVRARYRQAKNKREMIDILCDLTCATKGEMKIFLGIEKESDNKPKQSRTKWNQELARNLYESGKTAREIAEAVGVSLTTINCWVSRNYKDRAAELRTEREKDFMELWDKGLNDNQISMVTGFSAPTVHLWRKKNGLSVNVTTKKSKITDRRMEFYRAGFSDEEIADKVHATINAIAKWRGRRNLPPNRKEKEWND